MNKGNLPLALVLTTVGWLVLASPLSAAADKFVPPIVGLWTRTVTDPNDPSMVLSLSFQAYHRDHTEMINSSNPPMTGNDSLGVWTYVGGRTVKLEHTAWLFDESGNLTGTIRVRDTVTVDPSGETYSGTSVLAVCDTNVENCVDIATGDVTAVRRHVNF